jgi:hypothetical protein
MPANKPVDVLSKLFPDAAILLLYFFTGPVIAWQFDHPAFSATLLMLLNIAATGLGCFSFFSMYADQSTLTSYRNSLNRFQSALIGLSAFISCLGFLWWLVPFAGLKTLGVSDTGFFIGAMVYFVSFLAAVVIGMSTKKNIHARGTFVKVITIAITALFFFFAYCLLKMTMHYWQPAHFSSQLLSVLCLCVFYLPLRFFLLMRPPFSRLEYISFVLAFGWLLIELFAR